MKFRNINLFAFLSALTVLLFVSSNIFAQIDLQSISQASKSQGSLIKTLLQWATGIAFGIGAFKVIVKMMGDDPHSRDGIIKWVVAAIFSGIAFAAITWS